MKNKKKFEELSIKDNFIFGAVMRNPVKCKALLECILGIEIKEIKYPESEKTIDKTFTSKSIRLDVYVEDEYDTVYNIEMQTTDKKNLPKRTRYYQGMIDLNIIDKGDDYNNLKKSFVIFICDYDEFNLGRHIYTFEKTCIEDPTLKLGDDTTVIILNTKGTKEDVKSEVKELLDYIGGAEPHSHLTKSLDDEVNKVKSSDDWRRDYMTMNMLLAENGVIHENKKLVQLVRGIDENEISIASKFFKEDEKNIRKILELIKAHPEMDDKEIAELLI